MIIACPKCATGFFVAPEKIGISGRRVKCSKCKHIWHVTVSQGMLEKASIIAERIHEPVTPGSNLPAVIPLKISRWLYLLPIALIILNMMTFWVLYPNFTRELGICGEMCIEEQISIKDINYEFDKLSHEITIDYSIVNLSTKPVEMPLVQVKFLDSNRENLKTVYTNQSNLALSDNESTKIRAKFTSVPSQTKSIQLALGNRIKFWFQ